VEAIVRALYGEPHLLEPLGSEQRSQAGYTALRHQLSRHRWIAQHSAITIDRAKYLVMIWMGWPRASSDRLSRTDTQARPCARRGRALIMSAD
jgi:hypothetical protein